jgi:hypothetical protein
LGVRGALGWARFLVEDRQERLDDWVGSREVSNLRQAAVRPEQSDEPDVLARARFRVEARQGQLDE